MSRLRVDYADPVVRDAIHDLLDTSFSRLTERIRMADALGAAWTRVSTPFVLLDGRVAIAHAGVMAIPAVVAGRDAVIGGIHAVCTRPAYRGRGHFRAVMTEALEFCDRHFESTWLFTETPALYERFGFRLVEEHVFGSTLDRESSPVPANRPPASTPTEPFRALSPTAPEDVELLHRLLRRRAPVSERVAVVDPGWLFVMNEVFASRGFARLFYAEELDLIAAYEWRGRTLHLLDLVAERVPDIAEVLRRIPSRGGRVALHFPPDRVRGGPWEPGPDAPEDRWMVRGPLEAGSGPLALSPLGHC